MTKAEIVLSKAASVTRRLERIRDALSEGREAFIADTRLIEQAAFNVFLAMQECVDMGTHVVADEGWGAPATLSEVFDILADNGVITKETAAHMRRGTKLRNLIAHAYGVLDPNKLHDAAHAGINEIKGFLAEVVAWLEQRSATSEDGAD